MEPYESGPGRKWLFFLFAAAAFAYLLLRGATTGAGAELQVLRALGVLGFGASAWRAHGLGVEADERGLSVRTWRGNRRLAWPEVYDVGGEPRAPRLHLRDGTTVPLLDNWHTDPEAVGAEIRRRLQASRRSLA